MNVILDTSVLIEGLERLDLAEGQLAAISVVSLSELHFGVLRAANPRERRVRLRRLAMIESTLNPLPVTAEIARTHGAMSAALMARGRQPRRRSMDLMIAATAASHKAVLLTHDLDDFAGLDEFVGVRVPPLAR